MVGYAFAMIGKLKLLAGDIDVLIVVLHLTSPPFLFSDR